MAREDRNGARHRRFQETVHLYRNLADEPEARVWPEGDRDGEHAFRVLQALGVTPGTPETERALGDAAVVATAYLYAEKCAKPKRAGESLTVGPLRARLREILELLATVEARFAADPIGRAARLRVEEAMLSRLIDDAVGRLPKPASRFGEVGRKIAVGDLKSGIRVRRGLAAAKEAVRGGRVRVPLAASLPITSPIPRTDMERMVAEVQDAVGGPSTPLARHLVEAVQWALKDLDTDGDGDNQTLGAAPGFVLAWGGIELLAAWRPDMRPSSTVGAHNPLYTIIAAIHGATHPEDRDPKTPKDSVVEAVNTVNGSGLSRLAFDGIQPRTVRRAMLEEPFHDDGDEPWNEDLPNYRGSVWRRRRANQAGEE